MGWIHMEESHHQHRAKQTAMDEAADFFSSKKIEDTKFPYHPHITKKRQP